MKKIIILLTIFFCLEYGSGFAQEMQPRPEQIDTTIMLYGNDKIIFRYNYFQRSPIDSYTFFIESKNNYSEINIWSNGNGYYLDVIELGTITNKDDPGEKPIMPRFPHKYCVFRKKKIPLLIIRDLKRTSEYIYRKEYFETDKPTKLWKYLYRSTFYSDKNYQMIKSGSVLDFFGKEAMLEYLPGFPYGKWLKFKEPFVKRISHKSNTPDYRFYSIPKYFHNWDWIFDSELRWSATGTDFLLQFCPNDSNAFYFEIELSGNPCVNRAICKSPNGLTEYTFAKNGNLKTLAIKNVEKTEIYYYDTKKGYLLKKQTVTKDSPDTYLEEVYDTKREYEKELISRPLKSAFSPDIQQINALKICPCLQVFVTL